MGLHDIYHNFSNCKIFVIIIKKDIILTIYKYENLIEIIPSYIFF